jgi:hypothetical protein
METHLFEISIIQEWRSFLVRLKKWAKFFYVCTILTLVFDFINAGITLRTIIRSSFTGLIKLEWIVAIIFVISFGILSTLSGYFFHQFTSQSSAALKMENGNAYNSALRFLINHIIVSSILLLVNLLWIILVVYVQIKIVY